MAELNLPTTPSDGQEVTHENTKFVYSASKNVWARQTLNTRFENVVPTTNTSLTSTAISGSNLVFTKADGSTSNVNLTAMASGQVRVFATESALPTTTSQLTAANIQPGEHALVTQTDNLYIYAGGWRKIDSVNLTPSVSMSLSSHSFTAAAESIDVTYTINEPEGTPVTVTVANSGVASTNEATITHHAGNNTITILSGNTPFSGGVVTVSATDGTSTGTGTVGITLSIGYSGTVINHPDAATSDGDRFGYSSTISGNGDYAAFSAWNRRAIYIFLRSGSTWTLQQRIDNNDYGFGKRMSLDQDGNTLTVKSDSDAFTFPGKIYVYTRSGTTWTEQAALQPNDSGAYQNLGKHMLDISADGNTIVADGGTAVYTFLNSPAGTYNGTQAFQMPSPEGNDRLGYCVDMDGDYMIAAMPYGGPDVSGTNGGGSAAIFHKSGGQWVFQAELHSQFGTDGIVRAVAISGDRAYVGGSNYDSQKGRVAVYTRSGTTWTHQTNVTASNDSTNFGFALSADGNTVIVSAAFDDTAGNNAGRVFIYTDNMNLQAELVSDDLQAGDVFGYSVAIHGDLAVIGAMGDKPSGPGAFGGDSYGGAYVFERSGTTWTQKAKLTAFSGGASNRGSATDRNDFGASIDCFEGTTENTIVVGAKIRNDGNRGYVYVFVGSGTSYHPQTRFESGGYPTESERANGVGDFFGAANYGGNPLKIDKSSTDGGRIIVGAYGDDSPTMNGSGSISIFERTNNPELYIAAPHGKSWQQITKQYQYSSNLGPQNNSYFGYSVAIDNYEIIVGAYRAAENGGGTQTGALYYISGAGGWSQQQKIDNAMGGHGMDGQGFGEGGSISGDGNTIAVGTPYTHNVSNPPGGGTRVGRVYVYSRSGDTFSLSATIEGPTQTSQSAWFGGSVAIDNDGNTIITGAKNDEVMGSPGYAAGAAYILAKNGSTWSVQQKIFGSNIVAGDRFGQNVAITADGNTAIVGAPNIGSFSGPRVGGIFVFERSGITWSETEVINAPNPYHGQDLGVLPDISDDGSYIAAGSREKNSFTGEAYIFKKP